VSLVPRSTLCWVVQSRWDWGGKQGVARASRNPVLGCVIPLGFLNNQRCAFDPSGIHTTQHRVEADADTLCLNMQRFWNPGGI